MLSEREALFDVFLQERILAQTYGVCLSDAVGAEVRKLFAKQESAQISDLQKLFDAMRKLGYQDPAEVPQSQIETERKRFEKQI